MDFTFYIEKYPFTHLCRLAFCSPGDMNTPLDVCISRRFYNVDCILLKIITYYTIFELLTKTITQQKTLKQKTKLQNYSSD